MEPGSTSRAISARVLVASSRAVSMLGEDQANVILDKRAVVAATELKVGHGASQARNVLNQLG